MKKITLNLLAQFLYLIAFAQVELYKKVFGNCCEVPQFCGCGNCNGTNQ